MPTKRRNSNRKSKEATGSAFPQKPGDVLKLLKDNNVGIVDLRFLDFLGSWQHFSVPAHQLDEDAFEDGFPRPMERYTGEF